ncbi:MAG: DMT family transporter [Alphaproteobacteria bacterium]|nr:DMT family transporter [Alphaproteobacteria bacterium]MDP7427128.1 DMT family transporter [Alphaproteobacteria bacterium]
MVTSAKDLQDPGSAAPPEISQRDRLRGMVLVAIASFAISFGGLISRYMEDADAWQINIHRSLSTAAVVAVVFLLRYRGGAARQFVRIGWPGIFGAGLLAMAGIAFMQALTTTTVANTLFTLSAIPFVTAALAWVFLREGLSRVTVVTMIGAAAGVAVMLAEGVGGGSLYGNAMALVTTFGFSGYAVIIRRHRHIDMLPAYLLSAIMLCAVALLVRIGDWSISWWDLGLCFIWGGLLSGIGNIFFIAATRYLFAAEVTLFMLLEFALGPVWVWLFVNETPSTWTLAGGSLIMAAVFARTLYQVRGSRRVVVRGRLAGPV